MSPLSSNTLISCYTRSCDEASNRRSANYKPSHLDERYAKKACELKEQVKIMLEDQEMLTVDDLENLELIDDLQKMGICYHFEDEIKKILTSIYVRKYVKNEESKGTRDLYSTALEFILLRQHGFFVSQEIFDCFKNEKGEFEPCLGEDTKGLLQLYEASHLLKEGEETLEVARDFVRIEIEFR